MNVRALLPLLFAILLLSCSGKGPDIADPSSGGRTQASVLALEVPDGGELAIVKEPAGIASSSAYADANGAPLDRRIDAIYESFDRLFLLHRSTSSITVIDLVSRQKLTEIRGFADSASALCGIAFSNLSQGWAIDYNRPAVFHFDAVNSVLVDTFAIEGRPTSIGTIDDKVFVASQLPDGAGLVSIFRSNFSVFRIDKTLRFSSPVIYMRPNGNADAMILVSAGAAGGKPTIHSVSRTTLEQTAERAVNTESMANRIGSVPEFAAITRDNFLYLAARDFIYRIDVKSPRLSAQPQKWVEGTYDVIGADFWTDLLYAYDPVSGALKRFDADNESIDPLPVAGPVASIEFVNPARVR